jgi:hypothetical protein
MRYRNGMRSLVAGVLFSAVVLGFGGGRESVAQPAPAKPAEKSADELALEGRELALKDDFQGAYTLYMEAWMRKKSFELAGNLGVVELRLGKTRDAVEHFAYCEANFPKVIDIEQAKKLETLRQLLKQARAQVGAARIRVTRDDGASAEGAGIFVDGRAVGKVGAMGQVVQPVAPGEEVFVGAGRRWFVARLMGGGAAAAVIAVPRGGSVEPRLVLSCGGNGLRPPILMGFGVAAVSILAGVGSMVHAFSVRDEASSSFENLKVNGGLSACVGKEDNGACADLDSKIDRWHTYKWIGVGGVAGGALIAAATVWSWSAKSSSPRSSARAVQAAFEFSPAGGGAVMKGAF